MDVNLFVLWVRSPELSEFPHLSKLSCVMHLPLLKTEIEHITADIQCMLQSEALLTVWA